MKHIIVGTAGHIDHGKTALIKALTGTDTDRLQEEKSRGISIDLGFASLVFPGQLAAGIVDVPGHERFLKNMLAGVGGVDLALLIIAADEGVMPQTREHLAMLQCFGISHGVVVLTKSDKVEADWLALVTEEVHEFLKNTFLANAPVIPVSALTGQGLDRLAQAILTLGLNLPGRDKGAPFRLWIDRCFSVKGHGTVVTGSVLSGRVAAGDLLQLDPGGQKVRVRGVESHGEPVECLVAGQRGAINLGGVETSQVSRGMVISARGQSQVSANWDVLADWNQAVKSGSRIRLHVGTGEFIGRLYYFKNQPHQYGRLLLEKPLAGGPGDRGLLRLYSPQHLLGGIILVAPGTASRKLSPTRKLLSQAIAGAALADMLCQLLDETGQLTTADELRSRAGFVDYRQVEKELADLTATGKICRVETGYFTQGKLAGLTAQLVTILTKYHAAQPDEPGMGKEILQQKLGLMGKTSEVLINFWQKQGQIMIKGPAIALTQFAQGHGNWRQELLAAAEDKFQDNGIEDINIQAIAGYLKISLEKARAAQEIFIQEGLLVKVGEIHVYRKTIQNIVILIQQHFVNHPTLTVGELRDLIGTSRKVILPLLEYLDLHKYTKREGDIRRQGGKMMNISE
jgi:selenocysteine-specific elongation factor